MSNYKKIGVIDVNLEGCKNLSRKDINKIFGGYSESFRDKLEEAIAKEYPKTKPKKQED